ncbi:uncharacterized protein C7orf57 homolog isoform X2 [Pristis pectinata]|uniref:uncharacterized protein C7orf57 homolog isoform X2 n=1 Tax=Pristis pectinata TaxID=685728 RepID=UPI00223E86F6|nr:uncharacterized protein C7orf57 homolog isoform X2 [Pristis pectinata]
MNDCKIIDQSGQLKPMSYMKEENSNNKQRETSLMPGLGYMTTGEERFRGRRNVIFDSDSDYVKLAKRGGLPDLLTFGDLSPKPACASFRKPEWLTSESSFQGNNQIIEKKFSDSMSQDTVLDELEGRNCNLSPIEAADQQLREKEENQEDSGSIKSGTPEIGIRRQRDRNTPSQLQMEAMTLGTETNQQMMQLAMPVNRISNRFTRRKEPPVSMQKLLSFGYADDWFSEHKDVKTTKEQNMDSGREESEQTTNREHSVAMKDDVLLEGNQPTYRGKRMTGIRGCGKNKGTPENDSFFKIFGEHRLTDIPGNVENRMQSEIALA